MENCWILPFYCVDAIAAQYESTSFPCLNVFQFFASAAKTFGHQLFIMTFWRAHKCAMRVSVCEFAPGIVWFGLVWFVFRILPINHSNNERSNIAIKTRALSTYAFLPVLNVECHILSILSTTFPIFCTQL